MQIERTLQVPESTDEVWHILAEDYANVDLWARAVQKSEPNTNVAPFSGATVGGRICTASIGDVTETIQEYDAAARVLIYDAHAKAMPFFVRKLSGRWVLTPKLDETEVKLTFEADLIPPFDWLMRWAIRRKFRTVINETLEDLKLYAETGMVHPDKSATLAT